MLHEGGPLVATEEVGEGVAALAAGRAEGVEAGDAGDALALVKVLDLGLDGTRVDLVGARRVGAVPRGVVRDGREGRRQRVANGEEKAILEGAEHWGGVGGVGWGGGGRGEQSLGLIDSCRHHPYPQPWPQTRTLNPEPKP